METHAHRDSAALHRGQSAAHLDNPPGGSRRPFLASFLGWLSLIWAVPAFVVSLPACLWSLLSTPDHSEWGRFGAGGAMIALTWLGAIGVLLFALALSVCSSAIASGMARNGRLIALGVLGAVTVTSVSLWLAAYASEMGVWLTPGGAWEVFRWIAGVGGVNVWIEAVTFLAATVGLAIFLAVLSQRRVRRPKPAVEATGVSAKSRLAASSLALLLGVFGAHRFYVGKRRTGALMLALLALAFAGHLFGGIRLTWVWYGTYLMLPAVILWALLDFGSAIAGRMTDGHGRPVKNW